MADIAIFSTLTLLLVRIPQGVLQSPHGGVAHHRDFQWLAPEKRNTYFLEIKCNIYYLIFYILAGMISLGHCK